MMNLEGELVGPSLGGRRGRHFGMEARGRGRAVVHGGAWALLLVIETFLHVGCLEGLSEIHHRSHRGQTASKSELIDADC